MPDAPETGVMCQLIAEGAPAFYNATEDNLVNTLEILSFITGKGLIDGSGLTRINRGCRLLTPAEAVALVRLHVRLYVKDSTDALPEEIPSITPYDALVDQMKVIVILCRLPMAKYSEIRDRMYAVVDQYSKLHAGITELASSICGPLPENQLKKSALDEVFLHLMKELYHD